MISGLSERGVVSADPAAAVGVHFLLDRLVPEVTFSTACCKAGRLMDLKIYKDSF